MGSSSGLYTLENEIGEFIQTPLFLQPQWGFPADSTNELCIFENKTAVQVDSTEGGVHVNSAFFKNQWRVLADSAFCKDKVGTRNKLCSFKNHSGEFIRTPHSSQKEWAVQVDSTLLKMKLGNSFELRRGGNSFKLRIF